MDPISSNSSTLAARSASLQQQKSATDPGNTPAPAPTPEEPKKGIELSITPGENNAGPGEDRSQNSVIVELSTPNREVTAEVTREQAVDALERRSNRRLAQQFLGNPGIGNGPSPLVRAAVAQGAGPDDLQAAAVGAAQLQYARNTAERALDLANPSQSQQSSSSNNSDSPEDFADFANQALAAQRKQAVFATAIDKVESAGNNIDTKV